MGKGIGVQRLFALTRCQRDISTNDITVRNGALRAAVYIVVLRVGTSAARFRVASRGTCAACAGGNLMRMRDCTFRARCALVSIAVEVEDGFALGELVGVLLPLAKLADQRAGGGLIVAEALQFGVNLFRVGLRRVLGLTAMQDAVDELLELGIRAHDAAPSVAGALERGTSTMGTATHLSPVDVR